MRNDYCLVIFRHVQQPFVHVDLLSGLHVQNKISARCFPIRTEVEAKQHESVISVRFKVNQLVLFKLLQKSFEVTQVQVPVRVDVLAFKLELFNQHCLDKFRLLNGVRYVAVGNYDSNAMSH